MERDARLRVSLHAALEWLGDNAVELLAPRPTWIRGAKRIAEVTMLARYLLEPGLADHDAIVAKHGRDWLAATWQVLRSGELLVEAVGQDPRWRSLAMLYVPLRQHGRRNAMFERQLARLADVHEPTWFVRLANACAYRQLGISMTPTVEAIVAEAWCLRIPTYQLGDVGRIYETTHVIMWLAELDALTDDAALARLRDFLPRWIAHFRTAGNVDLVAELVIASHRLGRCVDAETWEWLLARQTPDGSVPELDVPSRALGRFHVTTVLAIAESACLSRRWCVRPPS